MSDFNLEHFGSRLTACRKAMDILQTDFSKQLRCTNGAYSLYERGKRRPSLEMLDILCQDFGLSLDHLVSCMTPYEQIFQDRFINIINQNPEKPLENLLADIGIDKRAAFIFTSGAGFPNAKVLKRICQYYDCSLEYLIGLSDSLMPSVSIPVTIAPTSIPLSDPNPLDELDADLRSKAEGYIDSLLEQQRERARELSGQEA